MSPHSHMWSRTFHRLFHFPQAPAPANMAPILRSRLAPAGQLTHRTAVLETDAAPAGAIPHPAGPAPRRLLTLLCKPVAASGWGGARLHGPC